MIEANDIHKSFGRRRALQGVSLRVDLGERIALVGPNASGKTTLVRCLLGLFRYQGEIRIAGYDPWRDHAAVQHHAAYVPQRAPAMSASVAEIARFWSSLRKLPVQRFVDCASKFGLEVSAVWDQRFHTLSGGTQQKLLAAAALATDCALLFLDEPTANLDPRARARFFELVVERRPPATIVLTSHRLDEVRRIVNRVVVLTDGVVAFDDNLDAFLSDPSRAAAAGLEAER